MNHMGKWETELAWYSPGANAGFSIILESRVLSIPGFTWWSSEISSTIKLFFCNQLNLHLLHNIFFSCFMTQLELMKHKFQKLDNISRSVERLSNHAWNRAMPNVSAYQQQWVPFTPWNVSAMWHTCHELACTKILAKVLIYSNNW